MRCLEYKVDKSFLVMSVITILVVIYSPCPVAADWSANPVAQ